MFTRERNVVGTVLDSPTSKEAADEKAYRGTSLIRNAPPIGPYSMPMPRALWWFWGGVLFLMSVVPL